MVFEVPLKLQQSEHGCTKKIRGPHAVGEDGMGAPGAGGRAAEGCAKAEAHGDLPTAEAVSVSAEIV